MRSKNRRLLKGQVWISGLILAVCIFAGCSSGKKEDDGNGEEDIVLTMCIENPSRYAGLQEDPVAKYIENRFGIRIELTTSDVDKENYYQLLETKLYSNDMDDIMDFGDGLNEAKCRDMLLKAAMSGRLLALDELIEQYAPEISGDSRIQVRNTYRRQNLYKDGKLYSLGSQGGVSCSVLPEESVWIRWDMYAKMDYPDIGTDEELLQMLENMQKESPETPRGEKIYTMGMTGGSGDFQAKEIICDYPGTKGYEPIDGRCSAYLNYGDMTVECPVADEESFFWNGVEFYYELNQRGLLDPDSFAMDMSDYEKKINKGIYLAGLDGELMKEKENILSGQGFRKAGYQPISPMEDTQAVFRYNENIIGSNELAISSTCKHPDKAIEFLGWCFSEEGSRILQQGTVGLAWLEEEGKLDLTEAYKKDTALGTVEMKEKYGKEKYAVLSGFSADSLDKNQNCIQIEQDISQKKEMDLWSDAAAHYDSGSLPDIIWNTCVKNIGDPPAEITETASLIDQFVKRGVMECVYAVDDKSFAQKKMDIIEKAKAMGAERVADWYGSRVDEVLDDFMPILEPVIKNYINSED